MYKKKSYLIIFEGIEGSGKSYHCKKLYRKIKKLKLPSILTKEPGGSKSLKKVRNIILKGKKNKFDKITDALLYLADRNEHIERVLKPAFKKKKIILCDRFIDSTIAYQVNGLGVPKKIIDIVHGEILKKIKPDLTFLLKLNVSKSIRRINQRKSKNRYDNFSKSFYTKVQNAFLKLAKKNEKKYIILDTSKDIKFNEKIIYQKFMSLLKNEKNKE